MKFWTQAEAIDLCRKVENICPNYGCHVALTGGCLYKDGPRKDADLLFYRIRENDEIDILGLVRALETIGIRRDYGRGSGDEDWVFKATWDGRALDLFFPEAPDRDDIPELGVDWRELAEADIP